MRAESRVAPRPSNHIYESMEPDRFTFVMDRSVDAQRLPPASCQVGSQGSYLARLFLPSQKGAPNLLRLRRLNRRYRLGLAGPVARLEAFVLPERIHPVGIRDRFDRLAIDVMADGPGLCHRHLIASRVHIGCHRLAQSRDAASGLSRGRTSFQSPSAKGLTGSPTFAGRIPIGRVRRALIAAVFATSRSRARTGAERVRGDFVASAF